MRERSVGRWVNVWNESDHITQKKDVLRQRIQSIEGSLENPAVGLSVAAITTCHM